MAVEAVAAMCCWRRPMNDGWPRPSIGSDLAVIDSQPGVDERSYHFSRGVRINSQYNGSVRSLKSSRTEKLPLIGIGAVARGSLGVGSMYGTVSLPLRMLGHPSRQCTGRRKVSRP